MLAEIINLKGPEGSGKTTISRRLADYLGKPRVVTGDILRYFAAHD